MFELTSQKIIEIHDKIIDKYGGQKGFLMKEVLNTLFTCLKRITIDSKKRQLYYIE
jgi:hypothetical protein